MALYSRTGFICGSRLNNSYYNKLSTCLIKISTQKHNFSMKVNEGAKSIAGQLIFQTSQSTRKEDHKGQSITTQKNPQTFDELIHSRKEEACRSIIVQVPCVESHNVLKQYCLKYGSIKNMFHYQKSFSQHFFIIEFENQQITSQVSSSAIFLDKDIVMPVKSTMLWYRNITNTSIKHDSQNANFMSTTLNDEISIQEEVRDIVQKSEGISVQIEKLYDALKLNEIDIRLRFYTTWLIENCFMGILPYASVTPFGSSVNGFGTRNCDLDLTFLVPPQKLAGTKNSNLVYYTGDNHFDARKTVRQFLSTVATTIQYFIPGICNVHRILDARVPIVKFKHEYTATDCDLSASNQSGVHMSELLWLCGEINPHFRPLVCIVRKWAETHKLTNEFPGQWISNFSLSLMVLFYLQQHNLLPSLKKLIMMGSHKDIPYVPDNTNFNFLRIPSKVSQEYTDRSKSGSLGQHLLSFFEYYVNFRYVQYAISVLEGKIVKKCDAMPLYICNPVETHLNVSKNVSQSELNRLKMLMQDAIRMLDSETHVENCNLMVLFETNHTAQKKIGRDLTKSKHSGLSTNTRVQQKLN